MESSGSTSAAVGEAGAPCMIKLRASCGTELSVPLPVVQMWKTIDTMIKDLGLDEDGKDADAIPIDKCSAETLGLVAAWCGHYAGTKGPFPPIDDEFADLNFDDSDIDDDDDPQMKEIKFLQDMKIPEWDREFLLFKDKPSPVAALLDVIEAANFLDIDDLLNIACKTVANMMSGKSPEEIRAIFNIECDYTPEELEQLKKDISWCEGIEVN